MSKKKKKSRQQFIVCYDIENSKIYEVYYNYKYRDSYIKCPNFQVILNDYIDNDKIYIENKNHDLAEKVVEWTNNEYNMYYECIGFTHKYLSNFYMLNCSTGQITSAFAYTPEDDNKQFDVLIRLWSECDCDILFTAHNLDYEYSYIRYNTNLLNRLLGLSKDYKIIAVNTSNIKSLEFTSSTGSKFIIKDTYLISNKSIKNLGKEFNLPKLDYDYEQDRIYPNEITDKDREYNQRDNEIAMTYILQLQKQLPIYQDITKIPISSTHHAKNICKYNPEVNYKKGRFDLYNLHKYLAKKYNMPDLYLYIYFYAASGGGLIGVNPKYTQMWIENILSFDIKSAHPSQFYNKHFPQGDSIREVNNYDYILKDILKKTEQLKTNPRDFYNTYNPSHDYLLLVEFTDLQAVLLPHDNLILSLGSGKQLTSESDNGLTNRQAYNYNGKTINGKTYKSKVYTKWIYGTDLIYHLSFYTATEIKIKKAYKYRLIPCDEYIISKSNYYVRYKELYKDFTKYARKHNYQDTLQHITENGAEEYTIKGMEQDTYIQFLDSELLRIKGIFNGLFGQEYQNIYHHALDFTKDFEIVDIEKNLEFEKLNEAYKETLKNTTIHYTVGAYTAMWSRFELACMIWHGINNGGTIVYYHTDSIKIKGVDSTLFDNWKQQQYSKYANENKYNLGIVDYEETYKYFYTPETLKNVGIENKNGCINIDITMSGIKANIYFNDILQKYQGKVFNDNHIQHLLYDLQLKLMPQLIPPEQTGKLIRNRKFAGVKSDLGQTNFGLLEPVEYKFLLKEY